MTTKDRRRKWLRWPWLVGIFVVCPLLMCGIGLATLGSLFGPAARRLDQERRLARQEGLPLTPDDLRRKPPLTSAENAAIEYKVLFPHFDLKSKENTAVSNCRLGKPKPGDEMLAAAVLQRLREPLAALVVATRKPHCDFEKDYSQGANLLFGELARAKQAAKLLSLQARAEADRGQLDRAIDTLAATQRLARHVGEEPAVIAYLVDISIESIVHQQFAYVLQRATRNDSALRYAQKAVDGFGPLPSIRFALGGEIVMGQIEIPRIRTWDDLQALSNDVAGNYGDHGLHLRIPIPQSVRDAFLARHIMLYRNMFARFPKSNDWRAIGEVMRQVDREVEVDQSVANTMNQILAPVYASTAEADGRLEMNRNLTLTSIRLLRDRLRTGSFPATLPDYGKFTLDPFNPGKRLGYRREAVGMTIYSVDRDGHDDGGKERDPTMKTGDLARTFR